MNRPANAPALVLVSHSRALAEAAAAMAAQVSGGRVDIRCAAGAGEEGGDLGTDALRIRDAMEAADGPAGSVVFMDLGSAVLSAEMALDLLDPGMRERVALCSAPFVEGTVVAATLAAAGACRDEIAAEARRALNPKAVQLGEDAAGTAAAQTATAPEASAEATIGDPHGLHARPASRIARRAAEFEAEVRLAVRGSGRPPASARSVVALMGLGARRGDSLAVMATGRQAQAAAVAIAALIESLTGDEAPAAASMPPRQGCEGGRGIPVSPGLAMAPLAILRSSRPVPVRREAAGSPAEERRRLEDAIARTIDELSASAAPGSPADILDVQIALLRDPALIETSHRLIDSGVDAAAALADASEEAGKVYADLDDSYLRGRAVDLEDVTAAVLRLLLGQSPDRLALAVPSVVLADEMPPSVAAGLDPERVLGVIDRRGGPTSHTAILLRGAGIPAIAGCRDIADADEGDFVAFDGGTGEVWLRPDETRQAEIRSRMEALVSAPPVAGGVVVTPAGERVELWANVAGPADARAARKAGAFGIGLLRTEFQYLDRASPPTEDEQVETLAEIFRPFQGAPIVVRTLDAGGDKPIPYLQVPREANPYLGLRGLRLSLARREIFETQLRAILRAGAGHDIRIMLPMVTEAGEVEAARHILESAHSDLAARKPGYAWPVPLGVMVEVPAAAIAAADLAQAAEFFSIGTNDLTQYTLAAERGHPDLGAFADATHPAVLRLIEGTVAAAGDRPVSVCGEAAAVPAAARAFVERGIRRLSMSAPALGGLAAALRGDRGERAGGFGGSRTA